VYHRQPRPVRLNLEKFGCERDGGDKRLAIKNGDAQASAHNGSMCLEIQTLGLGAVG